MQASKQRRFLDYDSQGKFIGESNMLGQAGFVIGTQFEFTEGQVLNGVIVGKGIQRTVLELDQTSITIQPNRKIAIKMEAKQFPASHVNTLAMGKGQPPTFLETWDVVDWTRTSTVWQKHRLRSEVLIAMSGAHQIARKIYPNMAMPQDFFQLQTAPHRACVAKRNMAVSDRIALFPFTHQLNWAKKRVGQWLTTSTGLNGATAADDPDEEYMVLQPTVRIIRDKDEDAFIEPFWFVTLTVDPAKANVKLSDWEGTLVSSVILPGNSPESSPTRHYLPMMALARDIVEGEQLCVEKPQATKKDGPVLKRLKLQ